MSDLTPTPIAALIAKSVPGEWGVEATGGPSDIFVLRSTNFTASGRLDYSDVVVRSLPPSKRASCRLEAGDILLEKSGGGPDQLVGRVNYFEGSSRGDFAYSNFIQRLSIAKPNHPKYVFFRLWQAYREGITARYEQQTTGIRNLKLKDLLREKIGVHAPDVQERVARILTTVDNQIEKTEALVVKYQSIKQGLMHDLFTRGVDEHGRLRPSRDEAPQLYKESELGWIPNGWRVGPLSSVVQQILDFRGRTPLKLGMNWGGGDIPALSANNVEIGRINFEKETYYGSDALYRRWMTNGDAEQGDVLMTLEAPLGNVAQIPDQRRYILSQRVILIKAKKGEMSNDYLAMQLGQRAFQDRMRRESTGTTATGIQRARLIRLPLVVPEPDEQDRIVSRIRAVVGLLKSEQERLSKCRHLKLGLMQDLLTGKVPVKPEPDDQDNGITPNGAAKAGGKLRGEGAHV